MPLQATSGAASYDAFGGGVPFEPTYIEQVFATHLYTGNGSTQTINNGIDLSGKGGMVWFKGRDQISNHRLVDTASGRTKYLASNTTGAQLTINDAVTAFNSSGFSLGPDTNDGEINGSGLYKMASWTFREQPKFFDVVTFTTNSAGGASVPHSLASTPGCVLIKRTGAPQNWYVWHRSVGNQDYLNLNLTAAKTNWGVDWISPDATNLNIQDGLLSVSSAYVAYLFAHNAGGFGLTGTDNVISCGSYNSATAVNLGYEPQWLMVKRVDSTGGDWYIINNMTGFTSNVFGPRLIPNRSNAEGNDSVASVTSTGFNSQLVDGAGTYIYIAIRRGPMKTPTSGTSVYVPTKVSGSSLGNTYSVGFPTDFFIGKDTASDTYATWVWQNRLTGNAALSSALTNAESIPAWGDDGVKFDRQNSIYIESTGYLDNSPILYSFRRAPGFFDVVCYTGAGDGTVISNNLGVEPELAIFKSRSSGSVDWVVRAPGTGSNRYLLLNTTNAQADASGWYSATSSQITFSTSYAGTAQNGQTFVAYLFASCPGVSKVFNFTGNGSSQTINCGFTGGARFVMIKRTDSTGDWYVWDSARGIVSGNDPRLSLNTTAAEVTTDDSVDTDSTGFVVNQLSATNVNVNGASYIGLAIA